MKLESRPRVEIVRTMTAIVENGQPIGSIQISDMDG